MVPNEWCKPSATHKRRKQSFMGCFPPRYLFLWACFSSLTSSSGLLVLKNALTKKPQKKNPVSYPAMVMVSISTVCVRVYVCVRLTRSATGDLRCSCTCLSTSTCMRAMGRARARAPRASSSSRRCSRQNSPSSSSSSQVSRSERDELCLLCTDKII